MGAGRQEGDTGIRCCSSADRLSRDPPAQGRAAAGDRGARHPKKSRRVLCQGVRAKYAFMRAHVREFRLVAMCRVLGVHRSGYYAWLRGPASVREREDQRLLGLIKHHWLASGGVYGYRKVTVDLREAGESCSRHRVHRLMKAEGLCAQVGYGSKPRYRGGPIGVVGNVLNRDFSPEAPNKVWVTDITYI